jgi:hypothetical protein
MPTLEAMARRASTPSLPSSSYDGSHLPWQAFRWNVLAPYRIRIVDNPPRDRLPADLLESIESQSENTARFEQQKTDFKAQVLAGRGFGPSPLFPPNLLPPVDKESHLARCMIPKFNRDALPERAGNQKGAVYELSVPRSGLGCGFSVDAFDSDELDILPSWLVSTGTIVYYETGYVSPGAAVYCPFLTFERARGGREEHLESANNQCAIGGSWCVRALQMLYDKAYEGTVIPDLPIAFSCTIDNSFAIINYHWIDHGESYCMAPLCKFDLTNDDHFSKFLLWVEAIGTWGNKTLLPAVKAALARIRHSDPTPPVTPTPKLTLQTTESKEEVLIKALKTTFDSIPWQLEDDEFTPVSSSTASWGSPTVGEIMISSLEFTYPKSDPVKDMVNDVRHIHQGLALSTGNHNTPPPAYAISPDLVNRKRLSHAMDEIRDLQTQLLALKNDLNGSNVSLRNELSGMRRTLSSVLKKESFRSRNRQFGVEPYPVPRGLPSPERERERSRLHLEVGKERPVETTTAPQQAPPPPENAPSENAPSSVVREADHRSAFFRWSAIMVSGQLIGSAVSGVLLRTFFLGCLAELTIRVVTSPHPPSLPKVFSWPWAAR